MHTPTFIYGTAWKKERTTALVAQALQAGFVAIDTANQAKHYNEGGVGEALSGVKRESLWLQTKFTPIDGQDHRLPYDPKAPIREQVEQSFQSSLQHLRSDYLDSYLLHGPYNYPGLGEEDWEAWGAIEKIYESGKAKQIGISNVNSLQLQELLQDARIKPMAVQNRCYANRGWDFEVRKICVAHGIQYQGFSLLTANPFVLADSRVLAICERLRATPEQVVFAFARASGMTPLTGTTNAEHMKLDLAALNLELTPQDMQFF